MIFEIAIASLKANKNNSLLSICNLLSAYSNEYSIKQWEV